MGGFRLRGQGGCDTELKFLGKFKKKYIVFLFVFFFLGGGGCWVGFGCERRIEVFGEIKKKVFFFGGVGSWGRVGGGGVRVD